MPLKFLLIAGIEGMLNTFLYRSPALNTVCKQLNNKILRITLKEFSTPLILIFNNYKLKVRTQWEGDVDCSVITQINMLSKLHVHQQLTTLIHRGKLKADGDLQVIQNFAWLAHLIEFYPTELLTLYFGDVVTEGICKIFRYGTTFLYKIMQNQWHNIADMITEEWRIAPKSLEKQLFTEEVCIICYNIKELKNRLKKLEELNDF